MHSTTVDLGRYTRNMSVLRWAALHGYERDSVPFDALKDALVGSINFGARQLSAPGEIYLVGQIAGIDPDVAAQMFAELYSGDLR